MIFGFALAYLCFTSLIAITIIFLFGIKYLQEKKIKDFLYIVIGTIIFVIIFLAAGYFFIFT